MPVTRFAPSPTGYLHLGHAWSALFAREAAGDGTFLLRIEDIDPVRCKPEFTQSIFEDLRWLGLDWPEPVRIQSQHMNDYGAALDKLRKRGLLYPCFCTRREIEQNAQGAGQAPHADDAAFIYPGTCRSLSAQERAAKLAQGAANWRLDIAAAQKIIGPLFWHDAVRGKIEARPQMFGDVVLARKDVAASYHLSVTVDDHLQGITLVTRGEDLFDSTHVHRLLQALLGYETPAYHHHPLLKGADGRRFAKRDQSVTLRALRAQGFTPEEVREQIYLNR
ncbi:MAG: tRNA glutamyl-Q(34) synthetase GluQRS [Alphaproteobacteria bacterium]|nr:tRNA glutamyl-Q(34) synthetase GluQRS [Alphaproteobacteria bacterium]